METANNAAIKPEGEVFKVIVNVGALIDGVINAEEDAKAGLSNALRSFLSGVEDISVAAVQVALTDNAKKTEDKGKKARISELRAVYQAVQSGFDIGTKGYLDSVKEARKFLKEQGLLPNGKEKKDAAHLANERQKRFYKKALDDGLKPEELEKAWEVEQARKEGVSQDQVDDEALAAFESWIQMGYDHKTIKRILTSVRALMETEEKTAAAAAKAVTL